LTAGSDHQFVVLDTPLFLEARLGPFQKTGFTVGGPGGGRELRPGGKILALSKTKGEASQRHYLLMLLGLCSGS